MDESDLSRRRFLQATGGAAAAAALAGCSGGGGGDNGSDGNGSGGGGSGNESTPAGTEGDASGGNASGGSGNQSGQQTTEEGPGKTDRTYELTAGTMTTFDPVAATDTESGRVIQNVFDALTNYPSGKINVENLLVSEYETSNSETTYTFTLKEGATFSNGDTVTASDIVYSFERLAGSEHTRRSGFILGDLAVTHETDGEGNYQPGSLGVSAEDERTVTMELSEANPAALEIMAYSAFSAMPENIVGDVPDYDGTMAYQEFSSSNPIGAGPYTLESYNSGTEASVTARDDYHGEGPMTAGSHWQIISKSNALYAYSVTNRNADHPVVPTAQYNASNETKEGENEAGYATGTYQLENGLSADFYRTEELGCFYIGFNCSAVPQYVRQAIAYTNNNQEIVENIFKRPQKAASHFVPPKIYPGGRSAYEQHAQDYPYAPGETAIDQARQLMEENGHGPDNPYEFTMTAYVSSTWATILNLLRDKLRSAHIRMSIKQTPFSTLVEQSRSGNTEGYTLGWIADWPAAGNFLKLLYPPSTDTSADDNLSGFNWTDSDPANQAASAWEKIQNNPEPEAGQQARNEGAVSMLEATWEGVPMLPIYHSVTQHMEYPWVYKDRIGAMGGSRAKHNTVQIGERQS
ncbi:MULTISPECIES: ABC transporter substrate-binding protein [Halococcus]|uniref:Dipeptide ABC transporter dipeptide-binding protein n=1 Tax=Halococcus salifodinae DSM 8989 TaxID=1227456 RepID=M0NAS7_9EURY|nr:MULTISPECIES: ABC transporter substrate-binding protein [Halococcus]EMA55057.1 dipeptide ABC transporter dipeptide-binding protein [Halococcus salifodinae DSM 8989]